MQKHHQEKWILMYCGECGAQNPDTNRFCSSCGKPLGQHRQPESLPGAQPVADTVPSLPAPVTVTAAGQIPATRGAQTRRRNWIGILSMVAGILSWVILTGVLALSAILLGIVSLAWFRRATGKIGISAIFGTLLAIGAIAARIAFS